MGRPRIYQNRAEQQAAWRRKQQQTPKPKAIAPTTPTHQYRNWRNRIAADAADLAAISEEMHYYRSDRSAEWEETDHGANITSAIDDLADLAEQLEGIEI